MPDGRSGPVSSSYEKRVDHLLGDIANIGDQQFADIFAKDLEEMQKTLGGAGSPRYDQFLKHCDAGVLIPHSFIVGDSDQKKAEYFESKLREAYHCVNLRPTLKLEMAGFAAVGTMTLAGTLYLENLKQKRQRADGAETSQATPAALEPPKPS